MVRYERFHSPDAAFRMSEEGSLILEERGWSEAETLEQESGETVQESAGIVGGEGRKGIHLNMMGLTPRESSALPPPPTPPQPPSAPRRALRRETPTDALEQELQTVDYRVQEKRPLPSPATPAVESAPKLEGKTVGKKPEENKRARADALSEKDAAIFPTRAVAFNPFNETAQQPFSTFSIDVDTASYTLTRLALLNGEWPPPEAVRVEEFVNFFYYHYPAPLREAFAIHAECGPSPFGSGLRLLRIGVQGRRTGREGDRRALLTILLDTSGSMSTPERIGLVIRSLQLLLDQLHPADRLALLTFDSQARLILDYTPASERDKILQALDSLQTSGSTHLEAGLRLAFSTARAAFDPAASNRILLFSDGAANLGGATAEEILALIADSRRQGLFLSVYGVGRTGVHDELLEQLANKGDGTYAFLDSIEEARRLFVDQLAATLHTIASDVKIQVEFNPERVRLWRQLGYENRQLTKEQFRDDRVDAGEVGAGQSVTALYELDFAPDTPADAPIGTVRIRYRDVESNRIMESAVPLPASLILDRVEALSPSTLLAACAAEFAEILRGSPFAAEGNLADVAARLRPVVTTFSLDPRVRELLDLIEQARSLQNRSP